MKRTLVILSILTLAFGAHYAFATDEHGHDHAEERNHQDNHEHGEEPGNDHGDEQGHEEGKVDISNEQAGKAGIVTAQAQGGVIAQTVTLTGQIILDRDTTASVRARFPGVVREVPVRLGQAVEKGQVLARIESNESLNDYAVTAPVSGIVLKRNTNPGNVAGEEEIFLIANLSHVWAKFHIFPKDAHFVREGQDVRVHTLDEAMEANAPLQLILPTADEASQTHVAIIDLDNKDGFWRPGMTVEGDVAVATQDVTLMVPQSALQKMEDRDVVFVQEGDSYESRPVKTGIKDAKNIEILEGLQPGETFVAEGSFIVKADILKSGAAHEH